MNQNLNIVNQFVNTHYSSDVIEVLSPGRVNMLGEHIDYNDGVVLPAAIDRYVNLTAKRLSEPILVLHALDLNQSSPSPSISSLKKTDAGSASAWFCSSIPAGLPGAARCRIHSNSIEVTYKSNSDWFRLVLRPPVQWFPRLWNHIGG